MGYVIAIVVVLVVAAAVAVVMRQRAKRAEATADATLADASEAVRPQDEPMTGLESALAQVTDREGRPIGERIEAESEHVDDLRVPDDTGPLLRRALDHVEHHDEAPGEADENPS